MITRKRKLDISDNEISLQVSFGRADVKRLIKSYLEHWQELTDSYSDESGLNTGFLGWLNDNPLDEKDVRYYVEHHPQGFASYEQPWRSQLSGWFWAQAIKAGFVIPLVSSPGKHLFSNKALQIIGI